MLTYQLQKRYLHHVEGPPLVFPNDVEVEVLYEPSEVFGIQSEPPVFTHTAITHKKHEVFYDSNTGKQGFLKILYDKISINLSEKDYEVELNGNIIKIRRHCSDVNQLLDILYRFHYYFPIFLSLEMFDPIVVKWTRGKVDRTSFRFQLKESLQYFESKSEQGIIDGMKETILRLDFTSKKEYRRLLASFYYYYVAIRLTCSGNSPYEFLSEVILNLCKSLNSLFGESRDEVRAGLTAIGFDKEDIENKYIPLMLIRNEFDVGHISLRTFKRNQLDGLYNYLDFAIQDIKNLLKQIVELIKNSEYMPKEYIQKDLSKENLEIIEKIIEVAKKRRKAFVSK